MTDGSARETYERWIEAQSGDPDLDALPRAPVVSEVRAPRAGVVTRLAARPIGIAALELGGGRRTKDDEIDHAVGVVCSAKRGQTVEAGQVLADVHARDEESAARAVEAVAAAYEIGDEAPPVHGILLDVVGVSARTPRGRDRPVAARAAPGRSDARARGDPRSSPDAAARSLRGGGGARGRSRRRRRAAREVPAAPARERLRCSSSTSA